MHLWILIIVILPIFGSLSSHLIHHAYKCVSICTLPINLELDISLKCLPTWYLISSFWSLIAHSNSPKAMCLPICYLFYDFKEWFQCEALRHQFWYLSKFTIWFQQTHTHTDFADLNVLTHNHCKFRLQALDKLIWRHCACT